MWIWSATSVPSTRRTCWDRSRAAVRSAAGMKRSSRAVTPSRTRGLGFRLRIVLGVRRNSLANREVRAAGMVQSPVWGAGRNSARYLRTRSPPENHATSSWFFSRRLDELEFADRVPEPRPGVRPEAVSGAGGDVQGGGRIGDAHPREVPELDQLRRLGVRGGQRAEGFVDGDYLGVPPVVGCGQGILGDLDAGGRPSPLEGAAAAGAIDQDVPHGL